MRTRVEWISAALLLAAWLVGCGGPQPTYVRGSEVQGLDDPAMGLGLDMRDLEQLMHENMASMTSSFWYQAAPTAPPPTVAILPMRNDTSEHIEPQLDALLGMVETNLVNSGRFSVVSHALREQIIQEMRLQQGAEFDPSRAVQVGRQLGVRYFITGRVYDSAERAVDMRRVQYFMFMQAIDVETGAIVWQNQSNLTKGIVPMET
jgi:penicillin-binding protein activator